MWPQSCPSDISGNKYKSVWEEFTHTVQTIWILALWLLAGEDTHTHTQKPKKDRSLAECQFVLPKHSIFRVKEGMIRILQTASGASNSGGESTVLQENHQISGSPQWERALASAAGSSSPSEPPPTRSVTVIRASLLSEDPFSLPCSFPGDWPGIFLQRLTQRNVAAFAVGRGPGD